MTEMNNPVLEWNNDSKRVFVNGIPFEEYVKKAEASGLRIDTQDFKCSLESLVKIYNYGECSDSISAIVEAPHDYEDYTTLPEGKQFKKTPIKLMFNCSTRFGSFTLKTKLYHEMPYRIKTLKPEEVQIIPGIGTAEEVRCDNKEVWEKYTKLIKDDVKKEFSKLSFQKGTRFEIGYMLPIINPSESYVV